MNLLQMQVQQMKQEITLKMEQQLQVQQEEQVAILMIGQMVKQHKQLQVLLPEIIPSQLQIHTPVLQKKQ